MTCIFLAWVDEKRLRGYRLLEGVEAGPARKIPRRFTGPLDLRHQLFEGAVRTLLLGGSGISLLKRAFGTNLRHDLLQDKVALLRLCGILSLQYVLVQIEGIESDGQRALY